MKQKFFYFLVLCLSLNLFCTSCTDNAKPEESKQASQKERTRKDENPEKTQISEPEKESEVPDDKDKTSEYSQNTAVKKQADTDMLAFSKPYLEMYNQENNAFIALTFTDRGFLPDKLWDKAKNFTSRELTEEETNTTSYIPPLNEGAYVIYISCDDDVLCTLSSKGFKEYNEDSDFEERFYMSKGEFFIIRLNQYLNSDLELEVHKSPDCFASSSFYYDKYIDGELLRNGNILHDVFIWEHNPLADTLVLTPNGSIRDESDDTDLTLSKKSGWTDLNGDRKNEWIYFDGITEYKIYMPINRKLFIDEKEIDLNTLSQENRIEKEDEYEDFFDMMTIIDIDKNDKYKEILLTKKPLNVEGDYFLTNTAPTLGKLYHYENNSLIYLGSVFYGSLRFVNNTLISTTFSFSDTLLFPNFNQDIYTLKEHRLLQEEEAQTILYETVLITPFLNTELNLYEEKDSQKPMLRLQQGDQLLFLKTDYKTWIKAKSFQTGKTGYIKFSIESGNQFEEQRIHFKDQPELESIPFHDIFIRLSEWAG